MILARRRTPFQEIELRRLGDGTLTLHLDGAIQFASGSDDAAYHGALAGEPASRFGGTQFAALVIGGGDGLAARDILATPGCSGVTLVEIDRGMLEFCSTRPEVVHMNRGSLRDPRVRLLVGDGRAFVRSAPARRFDLAVVDLPDPTPAIADMFQSPFYRNLLRHLDPARGVVSVQASGAGSTVERYVLWGLGSAMGVRPVAKRFGGRVMGDGAVVVGDLSGRR